MQGEPPRAHSSCASFRPLPHSARAPLTTMAMSMLRYPAFAILCTDIQQPRPAKKAKQAHPTQQRQATPPPIPPQPQQQPQQPVAGPAFPNPALAHLYAPQQLPNPAPPAPPTPVHEPRTAVSPRSAARQAALARAANRSPSPAPAAPAAPAPAPVPAPAAAAAAPAPTPAPAPVVDLERAESEVLLSHCPKCDLPLSTGSAADSEAHLRQCLDAGGATVHECPVCACAMDGWDEATQARHVDACCRGEGGAARGGTRDHVGASGRGLLLRSFAA